MPRTLIELFYWPPVSWQSLAAISEGLLLEACENFQKGSYRNRCHIAGPNGLQRLSIPLQKGKHQQTPIREVRIANEEPWQRAHWRSIRTAYGNAPYFEHYAAEVAPFFEKNYAFLFDLNLDIVQFLLKKSRWFGSIQLTEVFQKPGSEPQDQGVFDARGLIAPNTPTSADLFVPIPYPQVFSERHGFLPDLSALDVLFCCGGKGFTYSGSLTFSPERAPDINTGYSPVKPVRVR